MLLKEISYIHCIYSIKVRIGATNREQQQNVNVANVINTITHDEYRPGPEYLNDIALLELDSKIPRRSEYNLNKLR